MWTRDGLVIKWDSDHPLWALNTKRVHCYKSKLKEFLTSKIFSILTALENNHNVVHFNSSRNLCKTKRKRKPIRPEKPPVMVLLFLLPDHSSSVELTLQTLNSISTIEWFIHIKKVASVCMNHTLPIKLAKPTGTFLDNCAILWYKLLCCKCPGHFK